MLPFTFSFSRSLALLLTLYHPAASSRQSANTVCATHLESSSTISSHAFYSLFILNPYPTCWRPKFTIVKSTSCSTYSFCVPISTHHLRKVFFLQMQVKSKNKPSKKWNQKWTECIPNKTRLIFAKKIQAEAEMKNEKKHTERESVCAHTVGCLNLTWNVYMCTKWMCVLKYTRSDINDILVLRVRCRTFEMHNKQTSNIKRKRERKNLHAHHTHTHAPNGKWNVPHFLVFFYCMTNARPNFKDSLMVDKKGPCNDNIYIDIDTNRPPAHATTRTHKCIK